MGNRCTAWRQDRRARLAWSHPDIVVRHISKLGYLVTTLCIACGAPESSLVANDEPLNPVEPPQSWQPADSTVVIQASGQPTCESGKVIYLLTANQEMFAWDPLTHGIQTLGRIDCVDSVNSMAVQRDGTAWIGDDAGQLFRVNVEQGSCSSTTFDSSAVGDQSFGMAFVSNQGGSEDETLFLVRSNPSSPELIGVDPNTFEVDRVGTLGKPLSNSLCELTGKGDGTMFAFCPLAHVGGELSTVEHAYVAQVDKRSGLVVSAERVPFGYVSAWHVAHWGGAYYLFTANNAETTRVDRYDPGLGVKRVDIALPGRVLGAGVTTCAPVSNTGVR